MPTPTTTDLLTRFTGEVETFVLDSLAAHGAPGLAALPLVEVGAGDGAVAAGLRTRGLTVDAIDANAETAAAATAAGRPVTHADWLTWEGGPYRAVLFTRSLHHIDPLDAAVAQAGKLAPGGLVICDEFAAESLDSVGAQLPADARVLLAAAGVISSEVGATADPLEAWRERITGDHRIATGAALLEAIGAIADVVHHSPTGFIARFVGQFLDPTHPRADAVLDALVALEHVRCPQPIGFRLVAQLR